MCWASRRQVRQVSGLSDPSGFTLFGEMSVEDVDQAVADAQAAINKGHRGLAIHPDCGTNLVVQALLSVLLMQFLGRSGRGFSMARFIAGLLSMTALSMAAKVLGPRLQAVTTLADLRDRQVTEVYALRVFGKPARADLGRGPDVIHLCAGADPFRYQLFLRELKAGLDPAMADFNYVELEAPECCAGGRSARGPGPAGHGRPADRGGPRNLDGLRGFGAPVRRHRPRATLGRAVATGSDGTGRHARNHGPGVVRTGPEARFQGHPRTIGSGRGTGGADHRGPGEGTKAAPGEPCGPQTQ